MTVLATGKRSLPGTLDCHSSKIPTSSVRQMDAREFYQASAKWFGINTRLLWYLHLQLPWTSLPVAELLNEKGRAASGSPYIMAQDSTRSSGE
jgi:hypothetical protein